MQPSRPNPYTVGQAPPPRAPHSRLGLLTRGILGAFIGAAMNTLVRFSLTAWLLIETWARAPWPVAALLTYFTLSLEAIVVIVKSSDVVGGRAR